MEQKKIFALIVAMALVTYLPRLLPALLLRGKAVPAAVIAVLRYMPAAIIAALLSAALSSPLALAAAAPTLLVAVVVRNLFVTLAAGVFFLSALRAIFGG